MAELYLLRHGQASFNSDDYDRLSPLGHTQAERLGRALEACGLRQPSFISGAMRRHRETLQGLALPGAQSFDVDARWNELDHRALLVAAFPQYPDAATLRAAVAHEERPRAAFQRMFERSIARWMSGAHDIDYDETWTRFVERVLAAFTETVANAAEGRDIVVSTSGGPIGIVLSQRLGLPPERGMGLTHGLVNASYTHLRIRHGQARLCCLNVHAHLERVTYR